MAFEDDAVLQEVPGLNAGEVLAGHVSNTDTFEVFESGLIAGRFAKFEAGSLDNFDGSATPVAVGVVKRNLTGELGKTVYNTDDDVAELANFGYMTVDVVTGLTPARYGPAYAENAGVNAGEDYGKATTLAAGNEAVSDTVFWYEIKTDVWVVKTGKIL